jgi:hypothetical protein
LSLLIQTSDAPYSTRVSKARAVPVTFRSRAGLKLFGMLHEPVRRRADFACILLSPGVKMRVGPGRLYLRLTEMLIELGVPVLRFDCHGLGDSEGTLPEEQLREVYGQIEIGRFVDDTIDAMNWMQEQTGISRFILSGLCGGAITGLLAGARDARVAGLLALGLTPLIVSPTADPSRYMTGGQLDSIGRTYLQKLLRPQSWLRVLTLRTDFRLLRRSLSVLVFGRKPAVAIPTADDNASPLFPPAFFSMLRSSRRMLLIFGGSDRLEWEFEEKFVARHREQLAQFQGGYDVHTIPQANHVLSFRPWQDEMVSVSRNWLKQHFALEEAVGS